jgi:hypothetical protein
MRYGDEKREELEKLQKKLYSRNAPDSLKEDRTGFSEPEIKNEPEVREGWDDVRRDKFDALAAKVSNMAQSKNRFIRNIFIISLLFFVGAAGVAAFVFLGGLNMISTRNVDIKVTGPLSVGSGQEISFEIDIINNNNVDLNSVALVMEYPSGTRSADLSKELSQERFILGDIKSEERKTHDIKVVLLGDKGSVKKFDISLEYRVENSSALFYKEKVHEVSISSAPVVVTPTYPKEINSGQEIAFNVEVASNSKDRIDNFLLNMEYPFGFVFESASPAASFGDNAWKLTGLNPGEKRNITVRGSILGQDNEEKIFRVNVGTPNENDERVIAVPFSELTESILVKKPFIGLSLLVGGREGEFAAKGGTDVQNQILAQNNLPERLFNVSVEVSLSGAAFNKQAVSVQSGGFFQSANNTIIWDERSVPELADMAPGSKKSLGFNLYPLLYSNIPSGQDPEIQMTVIVKGRRILDSGSTEEIRSTASGKIVLATDVSVSSMVVRSIGSIENSGPIAPRVGVPTTYTVIWKLTNSFNQVSSATVRATLPPYVEWTGLKSPDSEIINYNEATKEISWNAGVLLPNTGFNSPAKEVHFQLKVLPSISQIGQTPVILGEATLTGIDKITGLNIQTKSGYVTTSFSSDPTFVPGDEKVIE